MSEPRKDSPALSEIGFHYSKSAMFRTIHVDGAFGGVTPQGFIDVNLYSERVSVPSYINFDLTEGKVGNELSREGVSGSGLVREIEVGAMISLPVAKALVRWLNDQIRAMETLGGEDR